MAVRIRLTRRGRKKRSIYDVIVADSRSPRDGRFIEKIGTYNPLSNPATIELNDDKALEWLLNGAQPSETVKAMLSYRGVLLRKHLQIGVLKGAITQEIADARFQEWKNTKENQILSKVEKLTKAKAEKTKQQLEAETRINKARTEALLAKKREADAALTAAVAEANSSEEESSPAESAE